MKKKIYQIVNPQKTKWCSFEIAQEVSDWVTIESQGQLSNMLPQKPETLLKQMKKGLTFLAIYEGKIVGHITLWKYSTVKSWGEVGALIVAPLFRDMGIGGALIRAILDPFFDFQIVATVKTEKAKYAFLVNGFEITRFDNLKRASKLAWRECCPCYIPPDACPKKDLECKLLIFINGR